MRKYLKTILATKTDTSLQAQFITISLFAGIIISFISTIFNYLMELDIVVTLSSTIVFFVTVILFFIAKYFEKYNLTAFIGILTLSLIFYPVMWIYNAGSEGPLIYFILYNAVISGIFFNKSNFKLILGLQVIITLALYYFEYKNPNLIVLYKDDTIKFIDLIFCFIVVFLLTFITIKKVMNAYNNKIEELNIISKEMEKLATTDPLTGLLNRRKMYQELDNRLLDISFAIILLDIDYFKNINDNYGHNCGDFILVELSHLLKESLEKDDLICRWGGEEFLIILPNTDVATAKVIMEEIKLKISKKVYDYDNKKISITITAGISLHENNSIDISLANADKALYNGKSSGRNRVVVFR